MPPFKRCLALINTRSGAREGRSVFASALQQYLDKAGIVHTDVLLPEKDVRHALFTHLPTADNLIVCGGDGTINSVVNVLASAFAEDLATASKDAQRTSQDIRRAGGTHDFLRPEVRAMLSKPIAIVPTGLQNSIAHSLGVSSAERSVSQFVVGRTDKVPVWEVRLDGRPLRYVCSYVAVGTYASVVARFHALEQVGDEYMALPSLGRHKFKAAAFYSTVLKDETAPCSATLVRERADEPSLLRADASPSVSLPQDDHLCQASTTEAERCRRTQVYAGPLRMLLAAQMPLQHGGYSLTPRATYKQGKLAVTVATNEASRLRMWHLLRNEAREGYIIEEDGVTTQEGVDGLSITFSANVDTTVAEAKKGSEASDAEGPRTVLLLLDGEKVHIPLGSVVTIKRMNHCTLPFLVC